MRIALALCSSLVAYAGLEVGYRIYTFRTIRDALLSTALRQIPADAGGTSIFDIHTGFRYRPRMRVQSDAPFRISWATNSHGHIARAEYPVAKPSNEFRIGLVGDSFTANINNTIQWGDVLEDRLNASAAWVRAIDGRRLRVLNFGLDGIGVVQFDDVVERMVMPFGIDLLIVNMLRSDVARRPYFRGEADIGSTRELEAYVESRLFTALPWQEVYPEVLAATVGRWVGVKPRLSLQAGLDLLGGPRHYERSRDAADASREALRRIRCYFPDAIFLVHPTDWDLKNEEPDLYRLAFEALVAAIPDEEFVDMKAWMPVPASREELNSWFNIPYDLHNSDRGLRVYGKAVAEYLLHRFQGARLPVADAALGKTAQVRCARIED